MSELRELLAKATPGPWSVRQFSHDPARNLDTVKIEAVQRRVLGSLDRADGELIAAAVNALPALLDELDRLRAEVERLRNQSDGV
ncbi:hypothetical protein UFOVP407_14 [uncultured Caudovirales phage]|uniref:Uncharacterized protein n=1 Tax=uncultured Caudovirales phage TaxID=2100421 RepID=A0A6J5M4S2_9CAUD|nr:hypothetical protein UFOVP407_14 [uncultured Caudovirales phage]